MHFQFIFFVNLPCKKSPKYVNLKIQSIRNPTI